MRKQIYLFAIIMVGLLGFASCSKDSKMARLLEHVPENTDIVAVGNIKTIIESAGGSVDESKIKLPAYITDELSQSNLSSLDELNSFLKKSALDSDACAVMMNYKDSRPIFLFAITDKKKFVDAIEDEGYRENSDEGKTVIYSKKVYESSSGDYDDYAYIGVSGSYAYWIEKVWVGSSFNPVSAIEKIAEDSEQSPYAKTAYADYITSGNAAGAAFRIPKELRQELRKVGANSSILDMYEGVICMKGSVVKEELTIDMRWFGEDGKAKDLKDFEKTMDLNARINPEALSYLGENESFVMAMSIKDFDWDNYIDTAGRVAGLSRSERATMSVFKGFLEKIDGTMALGIGLRNGVKSLFNMANEKNPFEDLDFTLILETREGKAQSFMEDLKGLMEAIGIPYNGSSDGFMLQIPDGNFTIYGETKGNFLVISNHAVVKSGSANAVLKSLSFEDYILAAAFCVDRSNGLMRDLNINRDIALTLTVDAKKFESTLKLRVKGDGSDGIIARVAKIILDISAQGKKLSEEWAQSHEEEVVEEMDEIMEEAVDSVEMDTACWGEAEAAAPAE